MIKNIQRRVFVMLALVLLMPLNVFALAADIHVLSDIPYGEDERHVLDVYYAPSIEKDAPVILMVHGGGWRIGDKSLKSVVENKVAHWVTKGVVFVSINYRLLPDAGPLEQLEDVRKAAIFVQNNAHEWRGSSEKLILMGHSAGAHLISLLSVQTDDQMQSWLGSIALDSAAYDVVEIMNARSPLRVYKKAFGKNPDYWEKASPIYRLSDRLPPFLAVCSSKRKDGACSQAQRFLEKAKEYGTQGQLLPVDFSHREINVKLGKDVCYTQLIDDFMRKLDPSIELILDRQQKPSQMPQRCIG